MGVAVCACAAGPRRAVAANLRRIRGRRGPVREAWDVARVFAGYASCLSEVLEGERSRPAQVTVIGRENADEAGKGGRGVVWVTAHMAGWEAVGQAFALHHGAPILMVAGREPDPLAHAIQDEARRAQGLSVVHAGGDPLSALPVLLHLKRGGHVALQIDRAPPGVRARAVRIFGEPFRLPDGPLRLAALTAAPIVPVFTHRTGYRRYTVIVSPPICVARAASEAELDAVAQAIARALETFARLHPTDWFHFRAD